MPNPHMPRDTTQPKRGSLKKLKEQQEKRQTNVDDLTATNQTASVIGPQANAPYLHLSRCGLFPSQEQRPPKKQLKRTSSKSRIKSHRQKAIKNLEMQLQQFETQPQPSAAHVRQSNRLARILNFFKGRSARQPIGSNTTQPEARVFN